MRSIVSFLGSLWNREQIVFGIHILVFTSFAISQPLFDLISKNADFLTAHHVTAGDVAILTLALFLAPALVLILTELGASALLGSRARNVLHLLLVTILVALVVAPLLKRFFDRPASLIVSAALVVGVLFTACYHRFAVIRTLATLSAVAVIVFPVSFLFFSPVSQIVLADRDESHVQAGVAHRDIPIVFVVFDEFPITSLMDKQGMIDANAVPNFAALAGDATWFRNASTVSDYTTAAIPAMLTGRYPRVYRLAHVSSYPQNLFTLLGDSYTLNVIEPFTDLCPEDLVGDGSTRQPFLPRMKSLVSDVSLIYLHAVLPKGWAEELPDVTKTLKNFSDGSPKKRAKESRLQHFDRFIQGIKPSPKPSLNFLHVMFPHVPWVYYPSGTRYNDYDKGFAGVFGLRGGEHWEEDDVAVDRAYQRHLLQIGFVDKLLGRLLARLKDEKLYERSLIIITADHGVSFIAGDNRRRLTDRNFQDIAGIPLFIKFPFQKTGSIDDRVVESIDILPTIAAVLDITLPWPVDGVSLTTGASLRDKRTVYHYGERVNDARKYEQKPAIHNRNSMGFTRKFELFGSNPSEGFFTIGPRTDLIGKPVATLSVTNRNEDLELMLDNEGFFQEIDPKARFVFGNISGELKVKDAVSRPRDLAISVNGAIQAVTRTVPLRADLEVFSAVVPERSFREGTNNIEVFAIQSGPGRVATLEPLTKTRADILRIEAARGKGESSERIVSANGVRIPIIHGALVGRLAQVVRGDSGETEFIGWAADLVHSQPVSKVLVFADGKLVRTAATNWHTPRVARYLGHPDFVNSGFWFSLPAKTLENIHELRLFAVSRSQPEVASELIYPRGYHWPPQPGRFGITAPGDSGQEAIDAPDGTVIPVKKGAVKGRVERVTKLGKTTVFSGWAVEPDSTRVPPLILIFADGDFIHAGTPNVFRKDVAKRFSQPRFFQSGFKIGAPSDRLNGKQDVRVIAVRHDGIASDLD